MENLSWLQIFATSSKPTFVSSKTSQKHQQKATLAS